MANEVSDDLLRELSSATGVTIEQLRAAFALARLYKRRSKSQKGGV